MPYGIVNTDTVRDSNGGILAPISSVFRNRIINGAMVIDQRNAGASVSNDTTGTQYSLDRCLGRRGERSIAHQRGRHAHPPDGL